MLMSVVQIHLSPPEFAFGNSKTRTLNSLAGFLLPQARNMALLDIGGIGRV
jgi:hypothetical protein